ncbi:hypothetical protein CDD83_8448 [Cordyceps sp. RAO-2017]|nr:hypothetical protein CDD83_8448 [Cordyceps sp. RAO-2017]
MTKGHILPFRADLSLVEPHRQLSHPVIYRRHVAAAAVGLYRYLTPSPPAGTAPYLACPRLLAVPRPRCPPEPASPAWLRYSGRTSPAPPVPGTSAPAPARYLLLRSYGNPSLPLGLVHGPYALVPLTPPLSLSSLSLTLSPLSHTDAHAHSLSRSHALSLSPLSLPLSLPFFLSLPLSLSLFVAPLLRPPRSSPHSFSSLLLYLQRHHHHHHPRPPISLSLAHPPSLFLSHPPRRPRIDQQLPASTRLAACPRGHVCGCPSHGARGRQLRHALHASGFATRDLQSTTPPLALQRRPPAQLGSSKPRLGPAHALATLDP